MGVLLEIIGFFLTWLFFALAIHITARIFGSNKGFGNALIMALLLELINLLFTLVLFWSPLILYVVLFLILIIAFMQTYKFSAGKGLIAAIVCIIIIIILLIIMGAIMLALGAIAFLLVF